MEETKPHTLGPRTLAEMEPHAFALQDHPAHPGMTCDQYRLELVQMRNARWTPDEAGTEETKPHTEDPEWRSRIWHKHSDEAGDRGPTESAGAYLERHLISQHGFSPSEASGNVADLTRAHQADHDGLHVFAGRNHPAHPGMNCHEYETMPNTWDTPPPAPYEAGTVIVLSEAQAAMLAAGGEGYWDGSRAPRIEIMLGGQLGELDRHARAYGWEIGRGQPLGETVKTTEGNPFLDVEWREGRIPAPSDIRPTGNPAPTLGSELTDLLERHGIPAGSDTPAFVVAEFLVKALTAFEVATNRREEWHTTIRIDGTDTPSTDPATIGVQMWKDTPDG